MKCIKDKCIYCREHDFRCSYLVCDFGGSFRKDSNNVQCVINDKIEDLELEIVSLKKYMEFIKENQ